MVNVKKSIVGKKYGRLLVVKQIEDKVYKDGRHRDQYICKCDCGNDTISTGSILKNGGKISCGCYQKEVFIKTHKKTNIYDMSKEYGIGYTHNTNKQFYFDKEDFEKIKDFCWSENIHKKSGYIKLVARNTKTGKIVSFHQIVFGKNVDHINRNTLDNRKSNLRFANQSQQNYNKGIRKTSTTGITGVFIDNRYNKKYGTRIRCNGKIYYGKYCNTLEEAKQERLQLEKRFCGEFSPKSRSGEDYAI